MPKINCDILYLIFKELQDDKKTLFSCLTVNKTWCETVIPILWRNPWKYLIGNKLVKKILFKNIIISHLSDKSRNNLKSRSNNFLTNSYQRPLFDYISFCRHLNLFILNQIITSTITTEDESILPIIRKEILKVFINKNTRITHLYISQVDYQINLIPEAKLCFSELKFLSCNTNIDDNILNGLTEICEPIKELNLIIERVNNNYGIINMVKAIKGLFSVQLHCSQNDETFCRNLENSLVKHANSIRHFMIMNGQLFTNIISSFINLNRLELDILCFKNETWKYLENLTLPLLQNLKAKCVPVETLARLIKNTNGYLTEIKINYIEHTEINNKCIIQNIYQNCPKLNYLKLLFRSSNFLELKNLLINCQFLNRIYIITDNGYYNSSDPSFNWDYLFEVLTKSSPTCLFNLTFCFDEPPKLESLKLFLDNWKSRRPMLLKIIQVQFFNESFSDKHLNLLKEYKTQGTIKKYNYVAY